MKLHTSYPVASDSLDHLRPLGAKQDNTHCPKFVEACMVEFQKPRVLDLGCAGGALVKDFLDAGCEAFGLEGSDYPKLHACGEWPNIPDNLATCDITKPFSVCTDDGHDAKFEIVCAWDVLEHIAEEHLNGLLLNICGHLTADGVFMASICTRECVVDKINYHVTVRPKQWWMDQFSQCGLLPADVQIDGCKFPRGSCNPLALGDWVGEQHGFHVILEQSI